MRCPRVVLSCLALAGLAAAGAPGPAQAAKGCVGVVSSALNSTPRAGQTATRPQSVRARWTEQVLRSAGLTVRHVSDADLARPGRLRRCRVVVTPYVFLMISAGQQPA